MTCRTTTPHQIPVTPEELFQEKHSIAAAIDHTLLKPDATADDIEQICDEALVHGFASVCVNPYWVKRAAARLESSPVKVCTVIGFPLGANVTETKLHEASTARNQGAEEIDMVINIGALRSGDYKLVERDIADVAVVAHSGGGLLKVILETCLLTYEQKVRACEIAQDAGAEFVKTSTGFSKSGATVDDVKLMRQHVLPHTGVKASGGIRTLAQLRSMMEAGATRIGASASVQILGELSNGENQATPGSY
jgi:deoxyribose-phosphate aldolase